MSSRDPIGSPVDIQVDVESESSEEHAVLTQLDASTQQQQSTAPTAGQGTSNPLQSVVSNENPSRKRALTSNVWDHASKYNDDTGYPMGRCNYCPKGLESTPKQHHPRVELNGSLREVFEEYSKAVTPRTVAEASVSGQRNDTSGCDELMIEELSNEQSELDRLALDLKDVALDTNIDN
ncbi:hypothetical protein COLO4_03440 [Corchorus olitorius]|uniref:Zinc finger, BED-type n=1 Tax=Corchorus olitorius TaxID=93759 RepID=A0A1R3KYQ9_9ROSI|nr:hypothetical protein COLO4_03440 [Corchorus olitorius]